MSVRPSWGVLLPLATLLFPLATTACLEVPEGLETPAGTAAAPSSAQEILDRHVAASGGAEALRALSQRTVEARVVFHAQPGCQEGDQDCIWEETAGQFVLYSTADARMYRRMVVGDSVLERGFDGENGWQMQVDPPLLVLEDPATAPVLREDALLHWYLDVDSREDLALELLPARKVQTDDGERQLDGIRWFAAGPASPESEKWFDRGTGLLHEEIERDTETGDLVRRVYSDYRDVDGVLVPWNIEQITEVADLPAQVVELRMQVIHHRPVREELFTLPELAPTEPVPDPILAALEQARAEAEDAPKDLDPQIRLARTAFQAAHFAEAKAAAKTALALDKQELEALYILTRVALLEGQLKEAESRLRAAVKVGLRPDEAARQLAWINLRRGDWQRAGETLSAAGFPDIGNRYTAFSGKPFATKMTSKNGCSTSMPIVPLAELGGDDPADRAALDDVIIVEVLADGDKLQLLFDTGASDLILSDVKAHSLVIGTDAVAPLAAGGPNLAQGQLEKLSMGEFEVRNVPVTMFPADQLGFVVGVAGVDGVLGIRPFAGRQITVDRERGQIEIVDTKGKCKSALTRHREGVEVPFWIHETHYLYVLGHMNGAEGVYLLNTGMRGADLTANEAAYAYGGVGAPPVLGGQPSLAEIERFSLADFHRDGLGAAWGFLQQNATSDMFRLDGMLGLGVLGEGRWTIDYDTQKVYISPPSEPATAEPKAPQN